MNSGDPAARAELDQVVAAAVAADPGFKEQLLTAAAAAPQARSQTPFLNITKGMLVPVAAAESSEA
ncbi:hypothetical protein [Catenulispora rubra]|uniref:hypothetical protein n=1 Tax=Catenulispora rubra TaxID=280293 RepID=UPI0018924F30|nr:hypothetical protein [Catenulispora rubra]